MRWISLKSDVYPLGWGVLGVIVATASWTVVAERTAGAGPVSAVEQSRLQWLANDEDEARAEAAEVGREIARETSAEVAEIEVKPDSPSQLVRDAIALHEPDRIILAVREGDDATWMEDGELADPAAEIEGVPITRVRL